MSRIIAVITILLSATLMLASCGDDTENTDTDVNGNGGEVAAGTDSGSESDSAESDAGVQDEGGFGAACETETDCTTEVCHEFGQIGKACTMSCTDDADCPEGSQGQKCNNEKVCRP